MKLTQAQLRGSDPERIGWIVRVRSARCPPTCSRTAPHQTIDVAVRFGSDVSASPMSIGHFARTLN
jgi:hypothetical protein